MRVIKQIVPKIKHITIWYKSYLEPLAWFQHSEATVKVTVKITVFQNYSVKLLSVKITVNITINLLSILPSKLITIKNYCQKSYINLESCRSHWVDRIAGKPAMQKQQGDHPYTICPQMMIKAFWTCEQSNYLTIIDFRDFADIISTATTKSARLVRKSQCNKLQFPQLQEHRQVAPQAVSYNWDSVPPIMWCDVMRVTQIWQNLTICAPCICRARASSNGQTWGEVLHCNTEGLRQSDRRPWLFFLAPEPDHTEASLHLRMTVLRPAAPSTSPLLLCRSL